MDRISGVANHQTHLRGQLEVEVEDVCLIVSGSPTKSGASSRPISPICRYLRSVVLSEDMPLVACP